MLEGVFLDPVAAGSRAPDFVDSAELGTGSAYSKGLVAAQEVAVETIVRCMCSLELCRELCVSGWRGNWVKETGSSERLDHLNLETWKHLKCHPANMVDMLRWAGVAVPGIGAAVVPARAAAAAAAAQDQNSEVVETGRQTNSDDRKVPVASISSHYELRTWRRR